MQRSALLLLLVSGCASLSIRRRNAQSSGCGNVEGNILKSPDYPHNYPTNTHCVYAIPLENNRSLKLKFLHFDMEPSVGCSYDYVEMKDNDVSYGKYCGKTLEGNDIVIEDTPRVYIVFHSDTSLTKTGFEMEFEQVNKGHQYGGHEVETVTVANTEALPFNPTTPFHPGTTHPHNVHFETPSIPEAAFSTSEKLSRPTTETNPGIVPTNLITESEIAKTTPDIFPTQEATPDFLTTNEFTPNVFPTHETTSDVLPTNEGTPDVYPTNEATPDIFPTQEATPDFLTTNEFTPNVFPTHETTSDVLPTNEGTPDVYPTNEATPDIFPTNEAITDNFPIRGTTSDVFPTEEATSDVFPTYEAISDVFPTNEAKPDVSPTHEATPAVYPTNEATPDVYPTNEATPDMHPTNEATPDVSPTNEATPDVYPTNEATPDMHPTNQEANPTSEDNLGESGITQQSSIPDSSPEKRLLKLKFSNDDQSEEESVNSNVNATDIMMNVTTPSSGNETFPSELPMGNESIVSSNVTGSEGGPTEETASPEGNVELMSTIEPTVEPEQTNYKLEPNNQVLDKLKLMALIQRIKFATLQMEELLIGKIVDEEVHESKNTNEAKREMDNFRYAIGSNFGLGRRYKRKVNREIGSEFIAKIRRIGQERKEKKRSTQETKLISNK